MGKEQAGFRVGYSTIDHIFVLQIIIELYQSVKKRVYCAFIDYRKAFDFVNRPLLWQKLLSYEINGKLFKVVKNMYDKAKSCIKKDTLWSHYFSCNNNNNNCLKSNIQKVQWTIINDIHI